MDHPAGSWSPLTAERGHADRWDGASVDICSWIVLINQLNVLLDKWSRHQEVYKINSQGIKRQIDCLAYRFSLWPLSDGQDQSHVTKNFQNKSIHGFLSLLCNSFPPGFMGPSLWVPVTFLQQPRMENTNKSWIFYMYVLSHELTTFAHCYACSFTCVYHNDSMTYEQNPLILSTMTHHFCSWSHDTLLQQRWYLASTGQHAHYKNCKKKCPVNANGKFKHWNFTGLNNCL